MCHPHGGTDSQGTALHDFSTNSNALGPCPFVARRVQRCKLSAYPDPSYHHLRLALARLHGVEPWRIVIAASASEFIHRITQWAQLQGAQAATIPRHAYSDYALAAMARGMGVQHLPLQAGPCSCNAINLRAPESEFENAMQHVCAGSRVLQWACEPSSPLGTADPVIAQWLARQPAAHPGKKLNKAAKAQAHQKSAESTGNAESTKGTEDADDALWRVADHAYLPLQLDAVEPMAWLHRSAQLAPCAWQMFSPNKALGMTGIRAAYAIAPLPSCPTPNIRQRIMAAVDALQALAPSWPVGAHGQAMLQAWCEPQAHAWLAKARTKLLILKAQLAKLLQRHGWQLHSCSLANFLVARPPPLCEKHATAQHWTAALRQRHIKLRDCTSFGLPGWQRLGVLPQAAQHALAQALAQYRPCVCDGGGDGDGTSSQHAC